MNDEVNNEMNEQNPVEPEIEEQQPVEPEVEVAAEEPQKVVKVDIGEWIKQGWELFKTDIVKFMVSALIVGVISVVTCLILAGPMMVGFFKCILKKNRGEDFEYGELLDGVRTQFLPAFLLVLVTSISLMIVSVILSIVPFIGQLAAFIVQVSATLVVNYMYLQMAEMDETMEVGGLIDLAKTTINKLKSEYIMFIVWALVIYVIGLAGAIVCIIGALFTWPLSVISVAKSYINVFKSGDEIMVTAEEVVVEEEI